jgi:hypothetical protein
VVSLGLDCSTSVMVGPISIMPFSSLDKRSFAPKQFPDDSFAFDLTFFGFGKNVVELLGEGRRP